MIESILTPCSVCRLHERHWSWCSSLSILSGKRVYQNLPLWHVKCVTQSAIPLKSLRRAMGPTGGNIGFCKFCSDFGLPFRSQTLINCTSLDFLRCVFYFYNRLLVICATSKHLERDKCWKVKCSYVYLNRPVLLINYNSSSKNYGLWCDPTIYG